MKKLFKNLNKKHITLISILVLFFPIIVTLLIYIFTDVDRLATEFPVWKNKKEGIVWQKKKPWFWRNLSAISDKAKWAIILSEDWAFYTHDGIDFNQLEKAVGESLKKGELARGASTISQQLVKNIFLTNERSLWRKYKEWIITIKLERNFKKYKILEAYLNIIELGPEIYGIERGARYYFDKPASRLSAREGAFLAMLLPSPIRYGESFRNKKLTKFALRIVNRNLLSLKMVHKLNELTYQEALSERFYWEQDAYELADDDIFKESESDSLGPDKELLLRSLKDLESEYEASSSEETPSDPQDLESDPLEDLESQNQIPDTPQDETLSEEPTESDDSQINTVDPEEEFEFE